MSGLCGKRSFFSDDNSNSPSSSPSSKKLRFFSSSPSAVDQLRAVFPDMDTQYLERALEESGYDVESAIKNLNNLHLGYAEGNTGSGVKLASDSGTGVTTADGISMKENLAQDTVQLEGAEWVELLVREMQSATSTDDARSRATRVLESLEKSISARARAEVAQGVHKEIVMLKEQSEVLVRDNTILKRAVTIQHERQKEYDERNQEVQHLKQMIAQYQEHLKNLEFNNYALTMHLKQSLESNVMPGSSNRDVF
ncbi:CUE domain-containing protein [Heracleum sosnowskyi]|uniref:CUE domain-containing protein n=1 Tax=Heracleum sosnowskyi TaxID=360622 RepID=A0AAD8M2F3_9APIA|nr:CUE domain-containing protein [Heracleum sosnowskyi]